ncbi:MAG TPA: hypothetical protein DCF92_10320, partial [Idiomarina sp.]|nr:hypothetical protein [Idiomarina sp.]
FRQQAEPLLVEPNANVDTQGWTGETLLLYRHPFLRAAMDSEQKTTWLKEQLSQHLSETLRSKSSQQQLMQLQRQQNLPVSGQLDAVTLAWLSGQYFSDNQALGSQ